MNARLPEPETAPKPIAIVETAIVGSLALAVVATFLFAWIADSVVDQHSRTFDQFVRAAIHHYASPAMTRAMFAITFMGNPGLVIAALVAVGLFLYIRWYRATIWLLITLAGATVLDISLKWAFHRARPTPYFGKLPHTYSFPSGHALYSFCFYGVLAGLVADRVRSLSLRIIVWTFAGTLVVAIGISRIYLGVHYPTDVVGGYLAAAIWVASMITVDKLRVRRKSRDR
jgi:undecaprenyl-diphosphatase